jgi:hypothetical protein
MNKEQKEHLHYACIWQYIGGEAIFQHDYRNGDVEFELCDIHSNIIAKFSTFKNAFNYFKNEFLIKIE